MRAMTRICLALAIAALGVVVSPERGHSQLASGAAAPLFTLKGVDGRTFDLATMKDKPLTILYFFDAGSRPSQEGLFSLNQLARNHKMDLGVWAITAAPRDKVAQFPATHGLVFPILPAGGAVNSLYQARQVLPVVCIIGPGLKVLDYFQGGGKTTEAMLTRLAERELQRRLPNVAGVIGREVVKKNPRSVKARTVIGYAELMEAKYKEAEGTFQELSRLGGEGDVAGKEGQAAVYVRQNRGDKALPLIREVKKKAPKRSYAHVLEGDLLYAQNRKKEAEAAYEASVAAQEAEPYHEGTRYNKLGRYYASTGQNRKAREQFDKAVEIDPYFVEGMTNKGLSYEKEGKWDQALDAHRQALAVDHADVYATVLARRAQEMIDLQKDAERSRRMDQLVKELAARFKSQKFEKGAEEPWTSRPLVISFIDFAEKGGLPDREGFSTVMLTELTNHLNASGRVKVVERVLIERVLEELNLGTSELANPETSLKLGKIFAAKLIGTGSIHYLPQGTMVTLRMIDTETTDIPQLTTKQFAGEASVDSGVLQINREILKMAMAKYPLRGYIASVADGEAVITIGSRQGVVPGTRFDILEEQKPLEYRGKTLARLPMATGQVEVVRVEPDLSYVRTLSKQRPLKVDDRVQERIDEAATQ